MKVHKITLMVVDSDNLGSASVSRVLEDTRYTNRCIAPLVIATETREVDWHDEHPLNLTDRYKAEFERIFAAPEDA